MGKNIIIPLLLNAQWGKAVRCVQDDNSRAKKWIVTQEFNGNIKTNVLPIHLACSNSRVKINIIEALALVHPDSLLLCESRTLRTPLHIAMRARVSDEIIQVLIQKCPKAASIQDNLGRIPLHYACSNKISTDTINKLIDICPESVCAPDKLGWTPLAVASSLIETPDVVETMLNACPEAVLMMTDKGSSCYAVAKANPSRAKERIREILTEADLEFQKMPAFRNIRAAEARMMMTETKKKNGCKKSLLSSLVRSTKIWGVRKRLRSNSIRCVV